MATIVAQTRFIDLNLLPEQLRNRSRSGSYAVVLLLLVVAAPLLVPLYRVHDGAWAKQGRLEDEWSAVERQLATAQADFVSARNLRRELNDANAAIAALDAERRSVLGSDRESARDLSAALDALPAGVRLLTIDGGASGITLTGEAARPGDALAYAEALARDQTFGAASVASLERSDAGVRFTIAVVP